MSVTTTSNTSNFLAAEWLSAYVGQEATQVPNILPYVHVEGMVGKKTTTLHLRSRNGFSDTAGAATVEGNALPVANWSPSTFTASAALYGFAVEETKYYNIVEPEALMSIGDSCAAALGRQFDYQLAALFSSLTAGTIGTSAGALTVANVLQGEAYLFKNHAQRGGAFSGFLSSQQIYDLKVDMLSKNFGITKVTADGHGKDYVEISATYLYMNTLVPTANSGVNNAGAMFSPEALAVGITQQPRVEVLDHPGYANWIVESTVAFSVGVYRPTFGVYIQGGVTA